MSEGERFRKAQSTRWAKEVLMGWSGLGPGYVLLDTPLTSPPFPPVTDLLRVALNDKFARNSPGFAPVGSQEWKQKIKQSGPAQADQASRLRDIKDLCHAHR